MWCACEVAVLSALHQTGGKGRVKEGKKEKKVGVEVYSPVVRVSKFDRQDQKVSNLD